MVFKEREYQEEATKVAIEGLTSDKKWCQVVVLPTGAGKSWVTVNTVKRIDEPFLILQPNKELLKQNYEKFIEIGGQATICCASAKIKTVNKEPYTEINGNLVHCEQISRVTFATIGTVSKYVHNLRKLGIKKVIIDECHYGTQPGATKSDTKAIETFLSTLGCSKILGLTATPLYLRSSLEGTSLKMMNRVKNKLFTDIAHITQIKELVELGFWSKLVYDLRKVDQSSLILNSSGTEFTDESQKNFFDFNQLKIKALDDVTEQIKKGRKSILIFAPSVSNANELQQLIPNSEVVHHETSSSDRNEIVKNFKSQKLNVLINCNVFSIGFDHPLLDCIIDTNPTNSLTLFYQKLGRGVRTHEQKENCLIIDYSGNVNRFGRIEGITFEKLPCYGWGAFNERCELMTDYPIDVDVRPTKQSIEDKCKNKGGNLKLKRTSQKSSENPVFNFGMYKGRKFWDVAKDERERKKFKPYLAWIMSKKDFKFLGKEATALEKVVRDYLGLPRKRVGS